MKKLMIKLRRNFGLFTLGDIVFAMETIGNAKDRADLEWKLKKRLIEMST